MANPETITIEPAPAYHTADMVRALNEAQVGSTRYECVYGELIVSPGPSGLHQIVVSRVFAALLTYVATHDLPYVVLTSPADISWGRDDITVQPDAFVVDRASAAALASGAPWTAVGRLPLAVEVISPSSRRTDRFKKRRVYQEQQVPLYWIVDPDERTTESWTPDAHFPVIDRERLVWHPKEADEPLEIRLETLFAPP